MGITLSSLTLSPEHLFRQYATHHIQSDNFHFVCISIPCFVINLSESYSLFYNIYLKTSLINKGVWIWL